MKEMDFISGFKNMYSCGLDKIKSFDIYPPQKENNPFKVKVNGKVLGCIYLHFDWRMSPSMVWIMFIKSYKKGNGSNILRLLCQYADEKEVLLYLEPVPDEGCNLNYEQLVAWYRRYGFIGDSSMIRKPSA